MYIISYICENVKYFIEKMRKELRTMNKLQKNRVITVIEDEISRDFVKFFAKWITDEDYEGYVKDCRKNIIDGRNTK